MKGAKATAAWKCSRPTAAMSTPSSGMPARDCSEIQLWGVISGRPKASRNMGLSVMALKWIVDG